MSEDTTNDAVRLHIFVDNFNFTSKHPKTVIISKHGRILDLKTRFEEQHRYPSNEQHWVINNIYCSNEFKIQAIVNDMTLFKNGYVAFLFIMFEKEKNNLLQNCGSFLEERYRDIKLEDRWNEPEKDIMIIAKDDDQKNSQNPIGWNCGSCSFLNKPFLKFCFTCGNCRPETFKMPKGYLYTKEDKEMIKKDQEIEERHKKSAASNSNNSEKAVDSIGPAYCGSILESLAVFVQERDRILRENNGDDSDNESNEEVSND